MKEQVETKVNFVKELRNLINRCSLENDSNTPDYALADYLCGCLNVYNQTIRSRGDQTYPETGVMATGHSN